MRAVTPMSKSPSLSAEITSVETGAGPMIAPPRDSPVVGLPRRRLTVRALLVRASTNSYMIE
jgi:hypothetical protein